MVGIYRCMRDLIRKILREEFILENHRVLTYHSLSNDEREQIKTKGKEIFTKFKLGNLTKINNFFENHGLFLGAPSKEFLIKNINDAIFATKHLPLSNSAREKINSEKFFMEKQYESIERYEKGEIPHKGRWYEFFHERSISEEKKEAIWSIVNLFDNNVSLWAQLINDWMSENPETQNIKSTSELIDIYFKREREDVVGGEAFHDLAKAMIERGKHEENIINRTWGGGQETEKSFVSTLLSNGFTDGDIRVFSGEKNVVDGVGIDLAVKCDNRWIPIQVKSNENDASQFIPNKGFATFPYGNTFKLISKIGKNNDQRNLEDLCEPLGKPVEKKPVSKIPSNVDYFGSQGLDT
jgi:hypothetical protein